MERARIRVFDTTLRDGEQSPGCSMNVQEKLRLAHQLDRLGVDIIEAGFPIASDGDFAAVREVSLFFPTNTVTAIIGPSGCGKSTFLRCLNRMHELSEGGWVTGKVLLDEVDIYASDVNPIQLRRSIGMVFQRPTPFPTMSIYQNVAAGLRVKT